MQQRNSRCAIILLLAATARCGGSTDTAALEERSVGTVTEAVRLGPTGKELDYFQCAQEGQVCMAGPAYVAFGANGRYLYRSTYGRFTCDRQFFGDDPIVGTPKACYFANYFQVASEGAAVVSQQPAGQTTDIAYGSNGAFFFKRVTGSYTCNNDTFGDPIVGPLKSCFLPLPRYNSDVFENETMTGLNDTAIAFGANGKFVYKIASGSHPCTVAAFGSGDPAPGVPKRCYRAWYTRVASEGQGQSASPGGSLVLYGSGANGNFLSQVIGGSYVCNNATFGGDPDLGHVKSCWIVIVVEN